MEKDCQQYNYILIKKSLQFFPFSYNMMDVDLKYELSLFPQAIEVLKAHIPGILEADWGWFPTRLREEVANFDFPSVTTLLYPAIGYMIALSLVRYFLQCFVFRVSCIVCTYELCLCF